MIKSADDLNEQKRESDVLIAAIDKCERLEKQLKIAVNGLEHYASTANFAKKVLNKIKELEK